jgi:hypothetical protein
MAALFVGIFLMTLAAGRLSEFEGGSYLVYLGGAAVVVLVVQAMAGWWHNRRFARDTAGEASPQERAQPREH